MSAAPAWRPFGRAAFEEARAARRPVLLVLDAPGRFEEPALSALAAEAFIPVLAERAERPDVHERYASPTGLLVLDDAGETAAVPERDEPGPLAQALRAAAQDYRAAPGAPFDEGPVWTGAVGGTPPSTLDPEGPRRAAEEAKRSPAGVDILLVAAAEWGDAEAGRLAAERVEAELARFAEAEKAGRAPRELRVYAALARSAADAASAVDSKACAEAAGRLAGHLLRFRSPEGGFRSAPEPQAPVYADENARTVVALLRAAPYGDSSALLGAAEGALLHLERSLYDPVLGMVHRRAEGATPLVYNLLGDNAHAALAFTEAYLRMGRKPYRDFADQLIRHMFQELWDRERGGFLDRAASDSDPAAMRRPRLPAALNAVAFEALWRLHETKGNANYRRWLDWGLKALIPGAQGADAAELARVQHLLQGGRMDLELVGRLGEAKTDALLAEIHRHYAPRRIVSFVDPDDQDYILAHKLAKKGEPQVFPRVFGCVDLRPVAEAGEPSQVGAVVAAVRAVRKG